MVSVWPDHASVSRQHPALGRSMIDGPGPPVTLRSTVSSAPSNFAVISRSLPVVSGARDTQRILLPRSGAGGALSGAPKITPRMSPDFPKTWGLPEPAPLKPVGAHVGNASVVTVSPHLPEDAAPPPAAATLGRVVGDLSGFWVQLAVMSRRNTRAEQPPAFVTAFP